MENESTYQESSEPTQNQRLVTVLYSLEEQIKKQTSLKFALIRGIVYGVGTVIGATVLVALFGGLIATAVNLFSGEEVLSETLEIRE